MGRGSESGSANYSGRGEGHIAERGRGIVQTGEEENRRAREGEEQKKHFGEPIVSTALPEGQPPAGD